MTEIEHRAEAGGRQEPTYRRAFTADDVANAEHRQYVGGKWHEIGQLQRDFLTDRGLRPDHAFLDVGCGSLRAGVQLVDYLDPGNYYGIDANPHVIEAGYDHELTSAQQSRLPAGNLRGTDRFDCDFGVDFDMAIAQSVFTHVSLNHIRLCMYRVAKVMKPGGKFYVTFFERGPNAPLDGRRGQQFAERNPYWYYRRDLRWAAGFGPWDFRYIGWWDHPRGQRMIELTRWAVDDE